MTDTTDPRPVYARALAQTAGLVAAVRADQHALPTPCTDYTVADLLRHLVGALHRVEHMGRGGAADEVPAWVDEVPGDDWGAAYRAAARDASAAWSDDSTLDAERVAPWGATTGRVVIDGYILETVTHGWDLARALGRTDGLDPELAEHALAAAHRLVPAGLRGGEMPFGPVVEAPAGADAYTRLAAWTGRRP